MDNAIYYGAPGTGKSFTVDQFVSKRSSLKPIRTVFHPDTQYSDFTGSIKPTMKGQDIHYEFRPGPFTNALVKALNNKEEPVFLIIEEINRAPAAAVFGELFQLLDRVNGESKYPIDASDPDMLAYINREIKEDINKISQLYIPKNLSILATMNSSDQAVMPMDTAFKRRWSFVYTKMDFNNPDIANSHIQLALDDDIYEITWPILAKEINNILVARGVEEDRLLGPLFVTSSELNTDRTIKQTMSGKLFVYLWDDVLRHYGRDAIFSSKYTTFGELSAAYLSNQSVLNEELQEVVRQKGSRVNSGIVSE